MPVTALACAEVFGPRKFRMERKAGNASIIHPGSLRHLLTFQGEKKPKKQRETSQLRGDQSDFSWELR